MQYHLDTPMKFSQRFGIYGNVMWRVPTKLINLWVRDNLVVVLQTIVWHLTRMKLYSFWLRLLFVPMCSLNNSPALCSDNAMHRTWYNSYLNEQWSSVWRIYTSNGLDGPTRIRVQHYVRCCLKGRLVIMIQKYILPGCPLAGRKSI